MILVSREVPAVAQTPNSLSYGVLEGAAETFSHLPLLPSALLSLVSFSVSFSP